MRYRMVLRAAFLLEVLAHHSGRRHRSEALVRIAYLCPAASLPGLLPAQPSRGLGLLNPKARPDHRVVELPFLPPARYYAHSFRSYRQAAMGRNFQPVALLLVAILWVPLARSQQPAETIAVDQVHAGMHGCAYTIFSGDQVEKFDLEVLGVMPNFLGPKQSIILVQLKGPKVEHTGVVA